MENQGTYNPRDERNTRNAWLGFAFVIAILVVWSLVDQTEIIPDWSMPGQSLPESLEQLGDQIRY